MKDRTTNIISKFAILTTTVVSLIAGSAAYAAGPHDNGDFFGVNTNQTPAATPRMSVPPMPTAPSAPKQPLYRYGDKPAQKWFASMDEQIYTHLVRPEEKFTLINSDFGNPPQLERVVEWTNTAGRCAKRYRQLAKILRGMSSSAPAEMAHDTASPVKFNFYISSLANWYDNSASVMEEYIKPRPAATTQEELKEQLDTVYQHCQNNKLVYEQLADMEQKIRDHFGVPRARYDDALMKYVTRKPQ